MRDIAATCPVRMRVTGTCMTPAIADGAEVTVRRARLYVPGDVVAVFRGDGATLAHRVLGYRLCRGRAALITQPDRGDRPDPPVLLSQVIGRVQTPVSALDRIGAVARLARAVARRLRPW